MPLLRRSTIQLLRFHFSLFLLPVYLFALAELPAIDHYRALLVFVILHLLVYPSSNGYNSYMDRDESPIGGLAQPLQPTRQLFITSVVMDALALLASLLVSPLFALGILLYILASRAYSYRGIHLKRFPIAGFLTVFICQGALVFFLTYYGVDPQHTLHVPLLSCIIASLLIGALYPLTQVYQHEADRQDGVTTISLLLGKRGSFVFSGLLFLAATFCLYIRFTQRGEPYLFLRFLLIMLPVVLFFLYWLVNVWRDDAKADFTNSLRMNLVSTLCTTIFFITFIASTH